MYRYAPATRYSHAHIARCRTWGTSVKRRAKLTLHPSFRLAVHSSPRSGFVERIGLHLDLLHPCTPEYVGRVLPPPCRTGKRGWKRNSVEEWLPAWRQGLVLPPAQVQSLREPVLEVQLVRRRWAKWWPRHRHRRGLHRHETFTNITKEKATHRRRGQRQGRFQTCRDLRTRWSGVEGVEAVWWW